MYRACAASCARVDRYLRKSGYLKCGQVYSVALEMKFIRTTVGHISLHSRHMVSFTDKRT